MGVDHRGNRETSPPEFAVGPLMQTVPPDFVIQVQKGVFCGLQNTPKYVSGHPAGGAHDAPPETA